MKKITFSVLLVLFCLGIKGSNISTKPNQMNETQTIISNDFNNPSTKIDFLDNSGELNVSMEDNEIDENQPNDEQTTDLVNQKDIINPNIVQDNNDDKSKPDEIIDNSSQSSSSIIHSNTTENENNKNQNSITSTTNEGQNNSNSKPSENKIKDEPTPKPEANPTSEPIPTPEPTPTPEPVKEKSLYECPFNLEAIRNDLIKIGVQEMGLEYRTRNGLGNLMTKDNSNHALPRTGNQQFQGERLEKHLKNYVRAHTDEFMIDTGGKPIKYFNIYIEGNSTSFTLYFLHE